MADLKEKILSEMMSNHSTALERNFEKAKSFFKISQTGGVEILAKESFGGEELILLYLIGKCYAKEVGVSGTSGATNEELKQELGKPEGSILPWLKSLRDKNKIRQNKDARPTEHYILTNLIEDTLNKLGKKEKKNG